MKEASARNNILPYLKQVKIIDDDGKPNDRAKKWRDDTQFKTVCAEIITEIYPQELQDVCPDTLADRDSVERWFSNDTGDGKVAVNKMVAFYTILIEADPPNTSEPKKKSLSAKTPVRKSSQKPTVTPKPENANKSDDRKNNIPSMNINLQIHISSDASPDQIDKIFESMAKHIYK